MIINLSYFEEDITHYLSKCSDTGMIVDLTGVVSPSITNKEVHNVRTRQDASKIEEKAIANYVSFCGSLSQLRTGKGNIRDLRVGGFPVYWVTDIAVKHYEIHWLSAVFFLDELLKAGAIEIPENERVHIVVPKGALHSKQFIGDIFSRNNLNPPKLISRGKNSEFYLFIRYVKEVLLNLVGLFQLKLYLSRYNKRDVKLRGKEIIIVNIYATIWEKAKWEDYWAAHYGFFSTQTSTWVLPFFNRYSGSNLYDFAKVPDEFLAAVPCFSKALSIAAQSFAQYIKSFLHLKGQNMFVGVEYRKALAGIGHFISYDWYRSFSSQLQTSALVIYDEEMYYAGRVLSCAFKSGANPKLSYFGLQHGLFFNPNHTVYTLTDKEVSDIKKGDGLPLPQKFIVWGEFFKDSFLLNNSLPSDFVVPLGSLKHSAENAAYSTENKSRSTVLNVLWCTTLVHYAKKEFGVMQDALRKYGPRINLVIRKHPYIQLPDETLLKLCAGIPLNSLSISANNNIKEDIALADVVVSTSGSTTFLDALLAGKISIRIYNYASYPALEDVLTSSSFYIYKSSDFERLIQALINNESKLNQGKVEELSQFVYNRTDRWQDFVQHTLALDNFLNQSQH
jgi:hypothetical protein